jgi:hypothetical protein
MKERQRGFETSIVLLLYIYPSTVNKYMLKEVPLNVR